MAGDPGIAAGLPCAADTVAAVARWRDWLAHERRLSPHTVAGYGRDLGAFLAFAVRFSEVEETAARKEMEERIAEQGGAVPVAA